jgi:CubicO group peptidase (beta-lactamase class C family)
VTPSSPAVEVPPRIRDALDAIVTDAVVAIGGQLAVARDGRVVLSTCAGRTLGRPMEAHHLHKAYCATKPSMALVVGRLIDEGVLGLDGAVDLDGGASAPLRNVLNHSAGLARPHLIEWRIARDEDLVRLRRAVPDGDPMAYSEVAAGLALERLVEAATGLRAVDAVEREVLAPLGLLDDVIVDAGRAQRPDVR